MSEPVTPRPSDRHVQSFARGLQVIRSFDAAHPSQNLSEVAAQTGLTRAGARRILLTLEGQGDVQAEARRFRLTPRILELGFAYLSSQPLWHLAEPVMQRLAHGQPVAGLLHVHGKGAAGCLAKQDRQALLGFEPLPQRTAATVTEAVEVMKAIDQAHQQGWCLVTDELEDGLTSLAAPIQDRSGRVAAALNISRPHAKSPTLWAGPADDLAQTSSRTRVP